MRPITLLFCLFVALAVPAGVDAGEAPVVDVDEIWQTTAERPHAEDAQRAQILRVLDHPLARDVARSHDMDLEAAARAVSTLDGADLEAIHQRAAAVESRLAGGDRVVISTTVIIIVLLIVILLLVAD